MFKNNHKVQNNINKRNAVFNKQVRSIHFSIRYSHIYVISGKYTDEYFT